MKANGLTSDNFSFTLENLSPPGTDAFLAGLQCAAGHGFDAGMEIEEIYDKFCSIIPKGSMSKHEIMCLIDPALNDPAFSFSPEDTDDGIEPQAQEAPLSPDEGHKEETSPEEKPPVRDFHFQSAYDLCSAPNVTNWLIKDIMDANSLGASFGESGSCKSFLEMDKGLSLSCLSVWHGHAIKENGPVFYIAGEGHSGLARRIKAWSLHKQVDLQDIPFFVSNKAAQFLDDPIPVCMAVDELKAINGNPLLVIIDTLSRNFGSGDESQNKDMAHFINIIDEYVRVRYQCAVDIVHHVGLTEKERMRGASALRAALDWEYKVQKKADGKIIYTCTKCKDHEEPSPIFFETKLVTIDEWIDPDNGEVMNSLVIVGADGVVEDERPLSASAKITLDALISIGKESIHIDTWREAAYRAGISQSKSQEAKKKAFQRAGKELREAGLIIGQGNYWGVRDTGQGRDNSGTCPPT